MSAIVCGKRSSFEEIHTSPPVSKRLRFSSSTTSPARISPSRSSCVPSSDSVTNSKQIAHLRNLFPNMDPQLLEKTLEECGDDLDSAIRSLNGLCLGPSLDGNSSATEKSCDQSMEPNIHQLSQGKKEGYKILCEDLSTSNLPMVDAQWVELLVNEMKNASDMNDAMARASRVLEALEQSIITQASLKTSESLNKENMVLKEQVEALLQENIILKRAVLIQHERQKEYDEKNQEVHHLRQVVVQYQEKVRALEVNNYALAMHLKQAQQSGTIPNRFHPDVF